MTISATQVGRLGDSN